MLRPSAIKQRLVPGKLLSFAWAPDMIVIFHEHCLFPVDLAHGLDTCLGAEDNRQFWIDVSVVRGDACNEFRGLGVGPATTTGPWILGTSQN